MNTTVGTNAGHGHAWERPDGIKARCGGTLLCNKCKKDFDKVRKLLKTQVSDGVSVLEPHESKMLAEITDIVFPLMKKKPISARMRVVNQLIKIAEAEGRRSARHEHKLMQHQAISVVKTLKGIIGWSSIRQNDLQEPRK